MWPRPLLACKLQRTQLHLHVCCGSLMHVEASLCMIFGLCTVKRVCMMGRGPTQARAQATHTALADKGADADVGAYAYVYADADADVDAEPADENYTPQAHELGDVPNTARQSRLSLAGPATEAADADAHSTCRCTGAADAGTHAHVQTHADTSYTTDAVYATYTVSAAGRRSRRSRRRGCKTHTQAHSTLPCAVSYVDERSHELCAPRGLQLLCTPRSQAQKNLHIVRGPNRQ